jgi:long-subunit fatty acid transport protein
VVIRPGFAPGSGLSNQSANTALPLPDQFVVGVAISPTQKFKLLADYQRTHWSLFDTVTITNQFAPATVLVESYRDTDGVRIGGEYGINRLTVRAGFDAHNAAAPDQSVTRSCRRRRGRKLPLAWGFFLARAGASMSRISL